MALVDARRELADLKAAYAALELRVRALPATHSFTRGCEPSVAKHPPCRPLLTRLLIA